MDRNKFRVWHEGFSRYLNSEDGSVFIESDGSIWLNIGEYADELVEKCPTQYKVEWCTGLKDKNDDLVYGGHRVLLSDHGINCNIAECRIEYIDSYMTFCPFTEDEWTWYKKGSNHFKYCLDGERSAGKRHFLFEYESYEIEILGNICRAPE